jgi:hypothetical protein
VGIFKTSKLALELKNTKTIKGCWELWLKAEPDDEEKCVSRMEDLAIRECNSAKTVAECLSAIRALKKYSTVSAKTLETLERRLDIVTRLEISNIRTLDAFLALYEICLPYTQSKILVKAELESLILVLLEKSDTLVEAVFVFSKIKTEMSIRKQAVKIFERLLLKKLHKSLTVRDCFEIFTTFYKEKDLLDLRTAVHKKALTLVKNREDQALAVVILRGITVGIEDEVIKCI